MTQSNHQDKLMNFGVPAALFLLYFFFYNQAQFTSREMIKTAGLLSISLLALTLSVGPLSRFIPFLDFFKAYRKIWGMLSFLAAFTHIVLVYVVFFRYDLSRFIDFSNPRYLNTLTGLIALAILALVTLTSSQKAIDKLGYKTWKFVQTSSYIALVFALLHFYLVSLEDGIFVIKNFLVQFIFWFSAVVLIIRVLILSLPSKKS